MYSLSSNAAYYLIFSGLKKKYSEDQIKQFIKHCIEICGEFKIKGTKDAIGFRKGTSNKGKGRWFIITEEY